MVREIEQIFLNPPQPHEAQPAAAGPPWWLPLAVGGGVAAAVSILCPLALGLAGFGAGGIVAGSAAAAWQASIGNVAAGSLFAFLQSAGATGGLWGLGAAAGAATGAVAGAGTAGGMAAGEDKRKRERGG